MNTQLLCTFSNQRKLRKTVDTIVNAYDVVYNKIFVLENVDSDFELMCTYNIDKSVDNTQLEYTISLHRKKQTNTLYTINALNELIKKLNGGVVDTKFPITWEHYKNSILLTQHDELKQLKTKIYKIIEL